jgi:hypothetical protein
MCAFHDGARQTPSASHSGRSYADVWTGAPGRTRTCDQWIRNPPLCPAELRARMSEGNVGIGFFVGLGAAGKQERGGEGD